MLALAVALGTAGVLGQSFQSSFYTPQYYYPTPSYYYPTPSPYYYNNYPQYYPQQQNNGNSLANTLIASQALSGSGGLGGTGLGNALVLSSALGGGGFNNNALTTGVEANALGGGITGAVLAQNLNQPSYPSYPRYGNYYQNQNNGNGLANTLIASQALGGSGLGGTGLGNALVLSSALGGGGFNNNALTSGIEANAFGGGIQGAVIANSLNTPSYPQQQYYGNQYYSPNYYQRQNSGSNLGTTLLLSNALSGTGTGSTSSNLAVPLLLSQQGGFGGNTLSNAVLANQFGGGLQGAVIAQGLSGR